MNFGGIDDGGVKESSDNNHAVREEVGGYLSSQIEKTMDRVVDGTLPPGGTPSLVRELISKVLRERGLENNTVTRELIKAFDLNGISLYYNQKESGAYSEKPRLDSSRPAPVSASFIFWFRGRKPSSTSCDNTAPFA